jgi:hypothetical protein
LKLHAVQLAQRSDSAGRAVYVGWRIVFAVFLVTAALYAVTYAGWSFPYQFGYALGGGIGGWTYDHASHGRFLLMIAALCLPSILLGVWPLGACATTPRRPWRATRGPAGDVGAPPGLRNEPPPPRRAV